MWKLFSCFSLWQIIHLHVAISSGVRPWTQVCLTLQLMHITMTLYFLLAPFTLTVWRKCDIMKVHCHSIFIKIVKVSMHLYLNCIMGWIVPPTKFISWTPNLSPSTSMWQFLEISPSKREKKVNEVIRMCPNPIWLEFLWEEIRCYGLNFCAPPNHLLKPYPPM